MGGSIVTLLVWNTTVETALFTLKIGKSFLCKLKFLNRGPLPKCLTTRHQTMRGSMANPSTVLLVVASSIAWLPLSTFAQYEIYPDFANPNVVFTGDGFNLKDPYGNDCNPRQRGVEEVNNNTIVGQSDEGLPCEAIGLPGHLINLRYWQLYQRPVSHIVYHFLSYNLSYIDEIVHFYNWTSWIKMEFNCWDPNRRSGTVSSRSDITPVRVGKDNIVPNSIILPGMPPPADDNSSCLDIDPFGKLTLEVDSFDNEFSEVLLTIPFNLNISDRLLPYDNQNAAYSGIGRDGIGAIIISLVAVSFIIVWTLLLYHSHRKREPRSAKAKWMWECSKESIKKFHASRLFENDSGNVHPQIKRASMLISGADFRPMEFSLKMLRSLKELSKGIEMHVNESDPELLRKAAEDLNPGQVLRSSTSTTRISNLGNTGVSFYQLIPSRLVSISSATLVVGPLGSLIRLPNAFDYMSTHWITLAFLTILLALAVFVTDLSFAGTVNENLGFFWWTGGIGLYATIAIMQGTMNTAGKGMLRLFRSIAPPTCEEFMFSYAWDDTGHPDDIRTIARAMYEIGLHVWIDTVKLVSGQMITSSLISAVRTANTVVIFLTPEYLQRYNTSTELLEALRYPSKIHIHVVKWDQNVYRMVDLIVKKFKVPKERITAHKMKEERTFELSSRFQEINDALNNGEGWYDLGAMLDVYSKDNNNVFDFQWWIKYASNLGGIPQTAPYPKNIKSWNLWGLTCSGQMTSTKDVRVGNVWLRADGRHVGTNASAFPWFVVPMLVFMLFPIGDIGMIASRELQIVQKAQSCADTLRNITNEMFPFPNRGIAYKVPPVLHAICRHFYRSPAYRTVYSAFKIDVVANIYDRLYDENAHNCTSENRVLSYWANPLLSGRVQISDVNCVWELQYYFYGKGYYIPRNVQIVFNSIFLLFYFIIVTLNFRQALNYVNPPPCLRPLLATSTLVSTKQITGNASSPKLESERLMEEGGKTGADEEDGVIPAVKVAIHGSGQIADKLREFLGLLGFLADSSVFEQGRVKRAAHTLPRSPQLSQQTISDAEPDSAGAPTAVPLSPRIDSLLVYVPFVWVDVHILSSIQDRENLYATRGQLRYDQMVVVIGGGPEVKNEGPEDSKMWLKSVLFIDCNDNTTDFATSVMENISLRTKDALVVFGHQAFLQQQ
ncbi:hypothetical protein BJ742DRAFT_814648 [Cladochytrium replicatum]|nr:hypothetical protein BJ742DRAFT_814648 [Cladochytrium replicatum]